VDEQGLEALSMRRLGAELGVEAMSLYRYFPSKDALLDGLVARLWDEVQVPDESAPDWKAAVLGTARSLRQLAHSHPNVYPLLLGRTVLPEPTLRVFDALLGVMRRAGFGPDLVTYAMGTLVAYAAGYAMVELSCRLGRSDLIAECCVPADVASRFADATRALSECNPDAQFDFGLETVVDGLEARLRRGSA
jgi:AcrR family transcriptional regulator